MFDSSNGPTKSTTIDGDASIWITILKWLLFLFALPPVLNFGALQNERQQLLKGNTTLFDIGFGQKLYMSCKGKGMYQENDSNQIFVSCAILMYVQIE